MTLQKGGLVPPPLTVVIEENLGTARVLLKNREDKIVGQLYTKGLKWIKPVQEPAELHLTIPSDGYNTIKGMKF